MAEPNKPKRTSAKSPKAKATSLTSKDESIEDAVVVEDNSADTLKGAETLKDADPSDGKDTPTVNTDGTLDEAAQGEKTPIDASVEPSAKDTDLGTTPTDGVETSESVAEETKSEDSTGTDVKTEDEAAQDEAKTVEATAKSDNAPADKDTVKDASEPLRPAAKTAETPPIAPIITPVPEPKKKSGFFPMVLGGVIAAGLGAGGLYYAQDNGWLNLGGNTDALAALIEQQKTQIEAQTTQIGTLQTSLEAATARIDALAASEPDLTPVTAALDALQTQTTKTASDLEAVNTSVAAIDPRITELMTRINEVETQPIPKAEIPAEVTAAFERKLADMLASVDTRFGELETTQTSKVATIETTLNDKVSGIETALTEKLTALEAAQAAAIASEEDLAKAASLAAARSALAQIEMALDSGDGFADELATLTGETDLAAPDGLSAVATDGVAPLADLKTSFPIVARDALTAATRDAAADGDVSPLSAFLRTQLGARSLEPREGSDPDAVLSRAEAAVASGDLETALTEIASLPQSGQDVLADWVASATARRAALDAAAEISAQIDTN